MALCLLRGLGALPAASESAAALAAAASPTTALGSGGCDSLSATRPYSPYHPHHPHDRRQRVQQQQPEEAAAARAVAALNRSLNAAASPYEGGDDDSALAALSTVPELVLRRHCALLAQHIADAERALAASSPQACRPQPSVVEAAASGGCANANRRRRHANANTAQRRAWCDARRRVGQLRDDYLKVKAALALRAVHDLRNGVDARPSRAELAAFGLRQELGIVAAEAAELRRELLAFQQHAKTVGDHQLLTVEARSRWEAKYHRYDVLKRRLAELRTQLQSCEDAMAEANRDQPVSGPHASALSHNATLAAVFRLAPLAQPSTAVTRGVVPEGVHPFAVSLDYDSGCASSVGADEAEEGEDGESSPSVTLECK